MAWLDLVFSTSWAQRSAATTTAVGNRVIFGSAQIVWPGVIERSVAVIEEASFLSDAQKRNILYNNAARFLRLSEHEIARHHGKWADEGNAEYHAVAPDGSLRGPQVNSRPLESLEWRVQC